MTQVFNRQRKASKKEPPHAGSRAHMNYWRIAVLANVFYERLSDDDPPDKGGDYDSIETINRICDILRKEGHSVTFIPANRNLPQRVMEFKPHICFNFSEGLNGDSRESQVPGFLELMGIPYTGSRIMANTIALDKPLTKTVWAAAGLPVAPSQAMSSVEELLNLNLTYPLIVKPSREGSGMGLDPASVVNTDGELRTQVAKIVNRYHQPALVEKFLSGREFTVGVMGHPGAQLRRPDFYGANGFHYFPIIEVESPNSTVKICDFAVKHVDADRTWMANLSEEFRDQIYDIVLRGHNAIGALDISRSDVRCDEEGNPFLLEINPLPGLSKNSHIPNMTRLSGMTYDELVKEILYLGAERYGLERTPVYPVQAEYHAMQMDAMPLNQSSAV